jgi:hypothetical protein
MVSPTGGTSVLKLKRSFVAVRILDARKIWIKSYGKHCQQETGPRAALTVSD